MKKQLVFVHGRSQQDKDPQGLKDEWIEAWKKGLAKNNLTMPISEDQIRFPYYGDTLRDMVNGKSAKDAAGTATGAASSASQSAAAASGSASQASAAAASAAQSAANGV